MNGGDSSKVLFLFHLNLQLLKPEVMIRICQSSKHNKNEGIKRKAGDDHIVIIFFLLYLYPFSFHRSTQYL